MVWLSERRAEWLAMLGERVHDTATFIENHDVPRWLNPSYTSLSNYK